MPSRQLLRSTRQRAGRKTTSLDERWKKAPIPISLPPSSQRDGVRWSSHHSSQNEQCQSRGLPISAPGESSDEHEQPKRVRSVGQNSGSASEAPPSLMPAPPVAGSDPPIALLTDGATAPPAAPTEPTGVPALSGDVTPLGRIVIGVMSLIKK